MTSDKRIQSALISVYYKDGLEPIVRKLHELGVKIISTGGTFDFISSLNIPAEKVEDITSYPDLFGGRVKTLHPVIMGGILFRRDFQGDLEQAEKHHVLPIDLVIVDLYPFEETLKRTDSEKDIIEKIDIGGISLIRAAAKNYNDVLIVPSRRYYDHLFRLLEDGNAFSTHEQRRQFATFAFMESSHYDTSIFNFFNQNSEVPVFRQSHNVVRNLRYGENPHQKGRYFGNLDELFIQHHGKEISYNNLQDLEAAIELVSEFNEPAFVIVKHGNACGVAVRPTVSEAWEAALSCDPLSAYGGVIASNVTPDEVTAERMNEVFFELFAAPSFHENTLKILGSKKNRILLESKTFQLPEHIFKSCFNGILLQDRDIAEMNPDNWRVVTEKHVPAELIPTLVFANKIVRHTKSNAIVLAGDQKLYGSGMGQTSRVDAVRLAISKARSFNHDLNGAVMASDAYFPFPDSIEQILSEGVKCIIQPGGSIRDSEVIRFCNEHDIAMIFTGIRHFKH